MYKIGYYLDYIAIWRFFMASGHYESHAKYGTKILPFIVNSSVCEYQDFSPHWHESIELLYCTSGKGHVIIDGTSFDFVPGRVLAVNKNQLHDVTNEESISYNYIIIFEEFLKENGIDTDTCAFKNLIEDPEMCRLFLKMHGDFKNGEEAIRIRLDATELIYKLVTEHSVERSGLNPSAVEGIKAAIVYINQNYKENISLEKIAEISNFSKYYFTKKFKEMTGRTYIDFLGSTRCQRATDMIRAGSSVSEVCFAVGYSDPAYFSRVFKKFIGTAPSKYK